MCTKLKWDNKNAWSTCLYLLETVKPFGTSMASVGIGLLGALAIQSVIEKYIPKESSQMQKDFLAGMEWTCRVESASESS